MKTEIQRIAQLKRLFHAGCNGVVWINFTASVDGIDYLSGHNAMGVNFTLSSDGHIFEGIRYDAGALILKGDSGKEFGITPIPDRHIQLTKIKAIDNSDFSKPAPSKNVMSFVENFKINIQ